RARSAMGSAVILDEDQNAKRAGPQDNHSIVEDVMRMQALLPVIIGFFIAADDPKDNAAKKDLERFQGNWTLISLERDGKKVPQDEAKKLKLTIKGNKFILRKDSVVVSEGSFSLDPAKKPKEIDETITTGPNKGKVFLAIYEIDDKHHK